MLVRNIPLKDCIPMPEVNRANYNPTGYRKLKMTIKKDGYDDRYFIRVLQNDKGKYEVFDGIHRMLIMKELDKITIPAVDETPFLTRVKAVGKGIKTNQNRVGYNPIDLANNLIAMGELISSIKQGKHTTRKFTLNIQEIADETGMSISRVSQFISLVKLPKTVQELLANGKLCTAHGVALYSLIGTEYESCLEQLADRAMKEDWNVKTLKLKIYVLKNRGKFPEETVPCDTCGKMFPRNHMSTLHSCPSCLTKNNNQKETPAMRRYEKFYDFVVNHYTERERVIPNCAEQHLEKLRLNYIDFEKSRLESISD